MMLAGATGGTQAVAAQGDGEAFRLTAATAICPEEHAGPFVGCTPWNGVTVTFTQVDSDFGAICETYGTDRVATCGVDVAFGSTMIASIDTSTIPGGYTLISEPVQEWEIPDGPPDGVFGGPTFILVADAGQEPPAQDAPAEVALPIYASLCADGFAPRDDCSPWEGAVVTVSADDGTWIGECVTKTFFETVAGCEVVVERGTTVVANISLDTLPAEYMLWTVEQVVEIPAEGEPEGPNFLAVPVEDEDGFTTLPVYASICNDALPPNDDCQPWEGVVITAVTNDDAEYADECVTGTFFETVAGCEIAMPRGSNVTAHISEDQIPEGYELFVEVPTWEMPAEGELESGPYFFLVKSDDGGEKPVKTPTPTAAAPVKQLPSTGSGPEQGDGAMPALLAGAGVLTMLGGVYVYARRPR